MMRKCREFFENQTICGEFLQLCRNYKQQVLATPFRAENPVYLQEIPLNGPAMLINDVHLQELRLQLMQRIWLKFIPNGVFS
jgi:hypothetical protein